MHNREHIVILRPGENGILLHTMYYPDEIRQVEEFRTDTSTVKENELKLAKTLVQSLEASFDPNKYKDDYRENLMKMIEAKVEGKEVVATAAPTHKAPVIDILEALKMSLAEGKKPPRAVREATTGADVTSGPREVPKPKKGRKSSSGD
jgi:DNA end-binding protein Ku